MGTRDRRVDAYIAKSGDFARPVLRYLRAVVHGASPKVAETIKWGMPFFIHRGPVCHMAAFKGHCAFGFWKGKRVLRAAPRTGAAMGQLGRILSRADLPPRRTLEALVRKALRLNAAGPQLPARGKRARRPAPRVPADLRAALAPNAKARATFTGLSPSGRREYVEWLTGAKRAETRTRRLEQAIVWLAAGKSRNWRYGA
jgi:hypothetical protein